MRRLPLVHSVLLGLCALWLAAPAAAYIVYMKDGSKIQAREKYTVEGGRAILTMYNGSKSFVSLDKIDTKKTEEANRVDYGNAEVLPGAPQEVAPSSARGPERERTLTDLLANREAGVRALPENRRPTTPGAVGNAGKQVKLPGGSYDLMNWARKPYGDVALSTELKRLLSQQGIEEVEIYEGTKPDHPFLEITTNSEGSVFKTIAGTAAILPQLRQTYTKVGALELLMLTSERERAGQFTFTPELADALVTKKVDLVSFFLRNVQY